MNDPQPTHLVESLESRMRVAVVYATDFAEISPGGIQNFIVRVGRFAPPDMEITYFGLGTPASLPRPSDQFLSLGSATAGRVNRGFLRALGSVRRKLAHEYDVIVVHRVEHVLVLPFNVPLALTLHGGSWNALRADHRLFGIAYPGIEAAACARANLVFSVDSTAHTRLATKMAHEILPIAAPASETFRSTALPLVRNDVLLTASRLVPEKRIDRLIRLSAECHRKLIVFGEGPSRGDLERMARDLAADVDFRGPVDAQQLAHEYQQGGVFCMSSAFEGYPLAAVEAATSGLAVVGVESPAVRQLEWLGAVSTTSVPQAIDVIESGRAVPISPAAAWDAHAPESVASHYWERVRRMV